MKIRDIEDKVNTIFKKINNDPRLVELKEKIRKEHDSELNKLYDKIKQLKENRPKKKPRWPENTPPHILTACSKYWNGTTEHAIFRIHLWNDKAVWTSYPAGGYSTNGGWNPTPAHYDLISLTEEGSGFGGRDKPKILKSLSFERCSGKRVTAAMMQEELDKL
jgi:hypothetical protein